MNGGSFEIMSSSNKYGVRFAIASDGRPYLATYSYGWEDGTADVELPTHFELSMIRAWCEQALRFEKAVDEGRASPEPKPGIITEQEEEE